MTELILLPALMALVGFVVGYGLGLGINKLDIAEKKKQQDNK